MNTFYYKRFIWSFINEIIRRKEFTKSYDAYYILFNELIYNNYNLRNKKKLNKLNIKKSEKNKININDILFI